jgi:putative membrane protein
LKKFTVILSCIGVALFAGIILWYGAGDILSALLLCGPGLLVVAASHVLPLLADSLGWGFLITGNDRPGLFSLVKLRWIGESINSLLPVAQVGGDVVRAGLLRSYGVQGAVSGASIIVEITITLVTQIIFTMMGIVILLMSGNSGLAMKALAAIVVMSVITCVFMFVQRVGLWRRLMQFLALIGGGGLAASFGEGAARLDEATRILYKRGDRLLMAGLWRMAGWVAGVAEVWLVFFFMGHAISVWNAFMLESLGQAIRAAAFMVPGALGIQEGGFVVLGSLLGITPEMALGLSLAKRVRELFLGIPGLVAWQVMEGKRLFFERG